MDKPHDKQRRSPLANVEIASRFEEVADLLEAQGANPFRVKAYRTAAQTLRQAASPACEILDAEGLPGLERLPGVGHALSRAIEHLVRSGRLPLLERLRGEHAGEAVLTTVAGIGRELAHRIHEQLGIETLAELEMVAYDGSLAKVPGMGRKRLRSIRESLAGRFRRRPDVPAAPPHRATDLPPVAELLDIDAEYRRLAAKDRLPRIAPKRFNPTGQAWLPILHTQRGDRHYTVLFSNTARAHELGTIKDWVVIYRDDAKGDGQWTVVTARLGKLRGRRIVRGREVECEAFYARQSKAAASEGTLTGP
jgi:hypothetical protein